MAYAVYTTESFDREFNKLRNSDKEVIQKMFLQLKENPNVGDQLRFPFFREKRLREKRVYYLVYEDLSAVLMVAIGGKKAQKETIDNIVNLLPEFKQYMKKILESS
jgi:mRNA-degrading endonuclease RelE of RelBE toxin-antitoxin system